MTLSTKTSAGLRLEREAANGACPECGAMALGRYPVHSEGGWFYVVKCQACLHSVRRERCARLGPALRLLSDSL